MHDESGGSGGNGDPGYLAIYDYASLRNAIKADSPEELGKLSLLWDKIGTTLDGISRDLHPIIASIHATYSSPGGAHAFLNKLDALRGRIDDLAPNMYHNAKIMSVAEDALRNAQREIDRMDGDGTSKMVDLRTGKDVRADEAGRIAYELNKAYGDVKDSLIVPVKDDRIRDQEEPGDTPGADGGPVYVGPVPNRSVGNGSTKVGRGSKPSNPAPGNGESRSRGGRLLGTPRGGEGVARHAENGGRSATAARGLPGAGRRIVVPGARGSGPLGGSNLPAARGGAVGSPGGTASAPPGGTAGTNGGSGPGGSPARPGTPPPGGGPGNPGPVHPGGSGAGAGPGGRRGRRLTDYERIEDEFVDKRRANAAGGLIGGAYARPAAVDAGPGVLGSQKHKSTESNGFIRAGEPAVTPPRSPQGFPDELKNGSFKQKDGTQFTVRRRSGGA